MCLIIVLVIRLGQKDYFINIFFKPVSHRYFQTPFSPSNSVRMAIIGMALPTVCGVLEII